MSSAPRPDPAERPSGRDTAARVARLFERHGRMVYGVSRAMLRNVHDAEDATQQTFLSAHRALLGGARVRDEGAWLATIARNECRARITAAMRTPLPLADEDLAAIPAPDNEAERRLQVDTLRRALAELPDRQREAVVLRDLYGFRCGEVATALGLSRPATEALLFRARRSMRRRLRPVVATVLAVPLAVQEGLAQAIPGFAAAGPGAAVAGAATGGFLANLTAGPVAAKFATAAVAVTTVGTVGAVESERAARDRAERPVLTTTVGVQADDDSSGPGPRGSLDDPGEDRDGHGGRRGDDDGEPDDGSGPGSGDDRDDDGTSTGKGSDGSSGPGSGREPSDDSSGPGGPEQVDPPAGDDDPEADPAEAPESDPETSSSGPGSGEDPEEGDSSGPGSGGSGSGSSSGSGSGGDESSGSGSSGSGSGDEPDD